MTTRTETSPPPSATYPVAGFTGSSRQITEEQKQVLRRVLRLGNFVALHHGDCICSDETAHRFATELNLKVTIHPPKKDVARAYCLALGGTIMTPQPYLTRNRNIVNACDLLIATPDGPERKRSGTWSTIRFARKLSRPIIIIWPDGQISEENMP